MNRCPTRFPSPIFPLRAAIGAAGVFLLAASGPIASAAPNPTASAPAAPILAAVAIPPQACFVSRVGGSRVKVAVLVPAGQEPHTYEPTPRQLAELSRTRLYFSIGVPFEKRLLEKIRPVNPSLTIVDTTQGISLRPMAEDETPPSAQPSPEAAGEPDPHLWLDPILVKTIAASICQGLSQADPGHASEYEENLKVFQNDLDALNERISQVLAPVKGRPFLVFHPAFGYFAARYGLEQVAVEAGGREPGARQVASLIDLARRRNVHVIFVQPQFSSALAGTISRAIGGAVVPIDPLAYDYLDNLRAVADRIEQGLRGET